MANELIGKWKMDTTENMDPIFGKLGMPPNLLDLVTKAEISKNGEEWTFSIAVGDVRDDMKFKIGHSFKHQMPFTGKPADVLVTLNGAELNEKYKSDDGSLDVKRKVVNGKLVIEHIVDGETGSFFLVRA